MRALLIVGTGSFLGGAFRYLIAQFVQAKFLSAFPFGTLTVNILGCFLIGVVFALSNRGNINADWRLFLATGILGGFTTFSAFSNETVSMLRDGQFLYGSTYITASVLLGLVATFLGVSILKLF